MQGSGLASFTVIMLHSVPSSLRLGVKFVLFFVTMLKTLSSSAFECGKRSANLAT